MAVEALTFTHVDNMVAGFKKPIAIIIAASSRHMYSQNLSPL
jgi:hypothetical protein